MSAAGWDGGKCREKGAVRGLNFQQVLELRRAAQAWECGLFGLRVSYSVSGRSLVGRGLFLVRRVRPGVSYFVVTDDGLRVLDELASGARK